MSTDNDFFGDIFDDPEDDPLLEGDSPPDDAAPGPAGAPSWMDDGASPNGRADSERDAGPERKQIRVEQGAENGEGIDALNRALGQGWRLVRLSLARPDGQQAASAQEAQQLLATLEQDHPQSLFDFGEGP
jgi:hypothetical protein